MLSLLRRGGLSEMARILAGAGLFGGLIGGLCAGARADFSVTGTYEPTAAGFVYSVNVTNSGPDDLLLVSLFQTGVSTAIDQTSAPAGFQTTSGSDGTTGFVDFSPALGSFSVFGAGTTVGAFRFRSDTLLVPAEVFGLDINGGSPAGTVGLAIVPEPGLVPFAGVALLALGGVMIRRRKA